jgi:hypothetical protein
MGKKDLAGNMDDESSVWEQDDDGDGGDDSAVDEIPGKPVRAANLKPSRQRIEEYFERKRLAEALQEDLGDDIFNY